MVPMDTPEMTELGRLGCASTTSGCSRNAAAGIAVTASLPNSRLEYAMARSFAANVIPILFIFFEQMRLPFLGIVMAALAWPAIQRAAVQGATLQNPPPQPPPAAPQGQGQQGRGGGQRANFPQQQRPPGDPALIARGR